MDEKKKELAKVIEKYFGADAAYLDISCFDLARTIIEAGWTKPVRCEKCRYYERAEYDDGYKMVCRLLKRQTAYNGFCYCGTKMDGDGNA